MKLKNIMLVALLASGNLHADEQQNINIDIDGQQGKIVIIKNDNGATQTVERTFTVNDTSDLQSQIDAILQQLGIEASNQQQTTINMTNSGDAIELSQQIKQRGINDNKNQMVHKQVIKINRSKLTSNNHAGLGLILDRHPKGWRVLSLSTTDDHASNSLKAEDIITHINGKSIIKDQISSPNQLQLNSKQPNSIQIIRDQKPQTLSIKTTEQSRPDILISTTMTKLVDSKQIQAISEELGIEQSLSAKQIYINTDHLDSNGLSFSFPNNKLRQWLGNKHHFSTVTESLGAYFGVTQGVLVLEVDSNNTLGLQDGDVIQSINKQSVYTPKDVVKILSQLTTDQALEIELIRHKKTVYLKS